MLNQSIELFNTKPKTFGKIGSAMRTMTTATDFVAASDLNTLTPTVAIWVMGIIGRDVPG